MLSTLTLTIHIVIPVMNNIEEVKLYDLNARYYNPEIARFLSVDPYYNLGNRVIGLYEINVPDASSIMQANNLYVYCGNNPIKYVDPSGEAAIAISVGSALLAKPRKDKKK